MLLLAAPLSQAQNQKFVHIKIDYVLGKYKATSLTEGPVVGSMSTKDFEDRFGKEIGLATLIDYMYANGYELFETIPAKEPAPVVYQLLFNKKK